MARLTGTTVNRLHPLSLSDFIREIEDGEAILEGKQRDGEGEKETGERASICNQLYDGHNNETSRQRKIFF